jgi:hypothetical protein
VPVIDRGSTSLLRRLTSVVIHFSQVYHQNFISVTTAPRIGTPNMLSTLPSELLERIIITCASSGSFTSIGALSAVVKRLYEIIYCSEDNHLWRGIFLTVFGDPRRGKEVVRREWINKELGAQEGIEWKKECIRRLRARKVLMNADSYEDEVRYIFNSIVFYNARTHTPKFIRSSHPSKLSSLSQQPSNPFLHLSTFPHPPQHLYSNLSYSFQPGDI